MTSIYLFITIAGIGLLVWDYFRCRTKSVEDRYMALYGRRNWDACNMELCLSFDREKDRDVKTLFQKRLSEHLDQIDPNGSLFHEKPRLHRKGIDFYYDACTTLQELGIPRKGNLYEQRSTGSTQHRLEPHPIGWHTTLASDSAALRHQLVDSGFLFTQNAAGILA
jgi:hypothetical protein